MKPCRAAHRPRNFHGNFGTSSRLAAPVPGRFAAVSAGSFDRSGSDAGCDGGPGGSIAPEDSFLVQVRGGSCLADQAISGRIEHLHSGKSEPFGSLAELFDFLGRYFGGGTGHDAPCG